MFETLGLSSKGFLVGLVGALISLRFFDELTWWGRFTTVIGGALFASYGHSWLLEWLELSSKHDSLMAFLLGLFGMAFVSASMRAIKALDIWGEIVKWLPGRKD
jgi:fructose-specific phosphotransferase system IIC component